MTKTIKQDNAPSHGQLAHKARVRPVRDPLPVRDAKYPDRQIEAGRTGYKTR